MFVDACAIVALMADEDTAEAYEQALATAKTPFTSPLAAWEAIIVLSRPDLLDCAYSAAMAAVVEWLDARGIEIEDVASPRELLAHAISVAGKHGIGKRHLSNFDCFHYAYAKVTGNPMLTLDQLLQKTDAGTLP